MPGDIRERSPIGIEPWGREDLSLLQRCVGDASHELRSPLSAILLALDELQPVCTGHTAANAARESAERGSLHMARIIEETCREYGVRYAEHKTFGAGVMSHFRWLKRMGQA